LEDAALTERVSDWSGEDYARVSGLQRSVAEDAIAGLGFAGRERVLDVGCGDGFLTHTIAGMVPDGYVVGLDPSRGMIASALAIPIAVESGPRFVRADARRLPFVEQFDVVVSFNALHWVPEQREALAEIASVLHPRGRVLIQVVCASDRASLESVAMQLCRSPRWARWFDGFAAPFVHVDPVSYGELAASAGLTVTSLSVADREWDFRSRKQFEAWCTVGTTAWTDRLHIEDRPRFVDELVRTYETVAGRPGVFRFTQMRAELRR
jgi:trans-aconitate 2-methyltransferase